jgi:hypothetical protein
MTDPDAAGGGGEYEVVVGKSPFIQAWIQAEANARQDSDGRMVWSSTLLGNMGST